MTDRLIIPLNENWSLGYDKNQWIVRKLKKRRDKTYWQGEKYIGHKKETLIRDLRELGSQIDPEAQAYIDAMPDTFKQWYRTSDAEIRRMAVCQKPNN